MYTKYNLKGSDTKIIFELRERTIHEKYLKRVGDEIFSRGIQSIHSQNNQTQTHKNKTENKSTQYQFCDPTNTKTINYDRQRLSSFLQRSSKLIEGLLTYKNSDDTFQKLLAPNGNNSNQFLSEGITFVYNALLKNRGVNDISFCNKNSNIIAVAYSKLNNDTAKDDEKSNNEPINKIARIRYDGFICVWDIRQPSYPIYHLICDDQVMKIEFLPNQDNIIIGGRENGCIAAWDTSEPNKLHKKIIIDEQSVYVRYPTYMTDCQWNNNHIQSIISLKFLNENEFCSVDRFGNIHGWLIELKSTLNENQRNFIDASDLNVLDLGCRDKETIKISDQFKFMIESNTLLRGKQGMIQCDDCISINPFDETQMLFAYRTSIYLLERIGSNVDIVDQYTLKYNVVGINHPTNTVTSVAFCPWKENLFLAGYENGMICLFDLIKKQSIQRFYDMINIQRVLSVSWTRSNDENIMFYGLFQGGNIRFFNLNPEEQNQSHIFEKRLGDKSKSRSTKHWKCNVRCKSLNSLIAMSNTMGNHTFSIHRIVRC